MDELQGLLDQANAHVFHPAGLEVLNPLQNGLQHVR
jgi:hypothetical protein